MKCWNLCGGRLIFCPKANGCGGFNEVYYNPIRSITSKDCTKVSNSEGSQT